MHFRGFKDMNIDQATGEALSELTHSVKALLEKFCGRLEDKEGIPSGVIAMALLALSVQSIQRIDPELPYTNFEKDIREVWEAIKDGRMIGQPKH